MNSNNNNNLQKNSLTSLSTQSSVSLVNKADEFKQYNDLSSLRAEILKNQTEINKLQDEMTLNSSQIASPQGILTSSMVMPSTLIPSTIPTNTTLSTFSSVPMTGYNQGQYQQQFYSGSNTLTMDTSFSNQYQQQPQSQYQQFPPYISTSSYISSQQYSPPNQSLNPFNRNDSF